jgi:hypothetical protein
VFLTEGPRRGGDGEEVVSGKKRGLLLVVATATGDSWAVEGVRVRGDGFAGGERTGTELRWEGGRVDGGPMGLREGFGAVGWFALVSGGDGG